MACNSEDDETCRAGKNTSRLDPAEMIDYNIVNHLNPEESAVELYEDFTNQFL